MKKPLIKPEECLKGMTTGQLFTSDPIGTTGKGVVDPENHQLQEETIIKTIQMRLLSSDCKKGFILQSYPETVQQLLSVKKILKKMKAKVVPFFFEIDSEVLYLSTFLPLLQPNNFISISKFNRLCVL